MTDTAARLAIEERPATARNRGRIRTIVFWTATCAVLYEMSAGSVWNLLTIEFVEAQLGHLGYPQYFAYILGVAHVAAAVVIAAPGFALLKEWAYAGAFFLWSGAVVSHWTLGDSIKTWSVPLLFGVAAIVSWALRPADRRLPGTALPWDRPAGSVTAEPHGTVPPRARLRAWALPIGLVVGLYAFAILTLPAFEDITREWGIEYGWIAK